MGRFLIFAFAMLMMLGACQTHTDTKTRPYAPTVSFDPRKDAQLLFQVDSLLPRVDSLVLVYFDDPFGMDSLRYTRYYRQFSVVGQDTVQAFIQPMNESVKAVEAKRSCRIEGKLWCYAGGKMIQTIYWSSRPSNCRFQYLIRDGLFYYFSLTDQQVLALENWRKRASKPASVRE